MKRRISLWTALGGGLIAVLLIAAAVLPACSVTVPAQAFDLAQARQAAVEDGRLIIRAAQDEAPEQLLLQAYGIMLRPGAYEIHIRYDSDTDGREDFYARGATFFLDSGQDILTDYINLNDSQTEVSGRVWVPLSLRGTTELTACLVHLGKGTVALDGVEISEIRGFRYVCILGLALLLGLLHALYVSFFSAERKPNAQAGVLLVLAGIVLAASLPNFVGFAYEGHDTSFHLKRIVSLAEELKYGQFPVRMHTTVGNGYGYPLSIYYGDFLLYLPAILYNCAVPLQTCLQIYVLLINALTCAAAYCCFRQMTGQAKLGVLGAALYVLSHYRMTNIFVRSAVGEYTAMAFIPLALFGLYRIVQAEKPRFADWLPLSLGMAGVAMSHVLSTEMLAFDLILLCLGFFRRLLRRDRLLAIVRAAILCALLCAWFLVPFLDSFLHQSTMIQTTELKLQERGTFLVQLFSVFSLGYGDGMDYGLAGKMPTTLGASLTAGMLVMLCCLYNRHRWGLTKTVQLGWLRMLLAVAALNLAMTLTCFPWDDLQRVLGRLGSLISSMQFPWRWLAVAVPLLTMGTVLGLQLMERANRRMALSFAAVVAAGLVISTGYFVFRFINEAPVYPSYFKNPYEGSDALYYLAGTDTSMLSRSVCEAETEDVQVLSLRREQGITQITVESRADCETRVVVPVFAYRGYRAFDGEGRPLKTAVGGNNRLAVCVPARYCGGIEVRFVPPSYWRAAELVSLAALGFVIVMLGAGRRKRNA